MNNTTYDSQLIKFGKKEAELLNKFYPTTEWLITEQFGRADAINNEKQHCTEVKVRDFSLEHFQSKYNGEFLIEVDKYNHLILSASTLGYKPIYLFGFTDENKNITAFSAINLQDIDLSKEKQIKVLCPKNSFSSTPTMVWKLCYIIPKRLYTKENVCTKSLS